MTTTHQAAHVAVLEVLQHATSEPEVYAALTAAIAAMKQQGELRLVGYMDANAEFLLPTPDGCVLSSHVDVLLVREPRDQFTLALFATPTEASR